MQNYKDLNTISKLQRSSTWVSVTIHREVSLTIGDDGSSTVEQGSAVSPHAATTEQRLLHGPTHSPYSQGGSSFAF